MMNSECVIWRDNIKRFIDCFFSTIPASLMQQMLLNVITIQTKSSANLFVSFSSRVQYEVFSAKKHTSRGSKVIRQNGSVTAKEEIVCLVTNNLSRICKVSATTSMKMFNGTPDGVSKQWNHKCNHYSSIAAMTQAFITWPAQI